MPPLPESPAMSVPLPVPCPAPTPVPVAVAGLPFDEVAEADMALPEVLAVFFSGEKRGEEEEFFTGFVSEGAFVGYGLPFFFPDDGLIRFIFCFSIPGEPPATSGVPFLRLLRPYLFQNLLREAFPSLGA